MKQSCGVTAAGVRRGGGVAEGGGGGRGNMVLISSGEGADDP